MGNLKKHFSDMRANTPKRVQWLLLVVALIVVIILITVLISGREKNKLELSEMNRVAAEISIVPDIINWSDVLVGETKEEKLTVSANAPIKVIDVKQEKAIDGFSVINICNDFLVTQQQSCMINMKYAPTAAASVQQTVIYVTWHDADATDEMKKITKVVVTLGATAPISETVQPDPVAKTPDYAASYTSEYDTEYENTPSGEYDDFSYDASYGELEQPTYVQEQIRDEIELIAPSVGGFSGSGARTYTRPPEACSDYAFAGYDNYGRQIGWIKPEDGTYKFHPFSDTNCNRPTGIYNPDNGIITDINNSGKKIGTDAEHIGFNSVMSGVLPTLSNTPAIKPEYRAQQLSIEELVETGGAGRGDSGLGGLIPRGKEDAKKYTGSGEDSGVKSTRAYDRQFILRQFKPIPATIVSDVRADPQALANNRLPVRATVDRNVYSDNGRNVIIPTGTLMLGYVDGDLPGPYTSIGRMNIKWYQFILPNGVEFNFGGGNAPFSGDAQGRTGIPGYGSTDYLEQFFMPMLTAIVPAAVNLIAPVSDAFVNQIDLDNNTVVQSGTVRSSELAKNQIITTWNQVAQKLLVDMMDNTVPPFTIAAGTRITVYSPVDLIASCGEEGDGKKCSLGYGKESRYDDWEHSTSVVENDPSWVGQVRSFAITQYCKDDGTVNESKCSATNGCDGYDYRTILFYCQSKQYQAKNNAKQDALYQNQQEQFSAKYQTSANTNSVSGTGVLGDKAYNEQVLGLTYNDEGAIQNPFESAPQPATDVLMDTGAESGGLTCNDGNLPDSNGCCAGETYTDMGYVDEATGSSYACCPDSGGDCFPPIL